MLAYGIADKDGNIAVDQDERFVLFRIRKFAEQIKLNKGEKVQLFEVRKPLDDRKR